MNDIIKSLKSGKYEVVDSHGVSVTQHFVECLEKEFNDINAKLVESESAYRDINRAFTEQRTLCKQQLVEKEQTIETQRKNLEFFYDVFNNPKSQQTLKTINQDKISFCIEQLKAVKLLLFSSWRENDCNLFLGDIDKIFDNQIKQLKGIQHGHN